MSRRPATRLPADRAWDRLLLRTHLDRRPGRHPARWAGLASGLFNTSTAAFIAGVSVAALGILAALTLIRRDELELAPAAEPALDLAA
jgi:hypothetical protein